MAADYRQILTMLRAETDPQSASDTDVLLATVLAEMRETNALLSGDSSRGGGGRGGGHEAGGPLNWQRIAESGARILLAVLSFLSAFLFWAVLDLREFKAVAEVTHMTEPPARVEQLLRDVAVLQRTLERMDERLANHLTLHGSD